MASYELDLGSFGRITPLAQIYASDKIYFRPTNEAADAQDAYFLLNFRVMWQSPLDRLGIDLFVENALDKDVATTAERRAITVAIEGIRAWARADRSL